TDGKGTTLNFLLEGSETPVPIGLANKVLVGCVFVNKPDPGAPVTVCKLTDTNHNLLMVAKVEAKEGADVAVTTVAGAELAYKRELLVRLDYSRGKRTYLSDMDANIVQELGEDFFERRYVRDKNKNGNELQIGGQRFSKGLFLPVTTKLEYK